MTRIMILDLIQQNVTKNKIYNVSYIKTEEGTDIYYFNNDKGHKTYVYYDKKYYSYPEGEFIAFKNDRELANYMLDNVDGFDKAIANLAMVFSN